MSNGVLEPQTGSVTYKRSALIKRWNFVATRGVVYLVPRLHVCRTVHVGLLGPVGCARSIVSLPSFDGAFEAGIE
jgi:hypothetical protein